MAWKDFAQTAEYKRLTKFEKKDAAGQYFDQKVAQDVPEADRGEARSQFIEQKYSEGPGLLSHLAQVTKDSLSGAVDDYRIAGRATADLPMGITQAVDDNMEGDLGLSDFGATTLTGIANMTGSNLSPEDFNDVKVSDSIANVAGESDELAASRPAGGLIRGTVQGFQIPGPAKWVTEGKMVSQVIKGGAVGGIIGTAAGYVQPQAANTIEDRNNNRLSSAKSMGETGALFGAAAPPILGAFRYARDYTTRVGAEDLLARNVQDSLGNTLDDRAKQLYDRNIEIEKFNNTLPAGQKYQPNTNAILDAPELDKINYDANIGGGADRAAALANKQTSNLEVVGGQLDKRLNPNATMNNFKAQARTIIDDPVTLVNDAKKIVKDNGLSGAQARAAEGRYIRQTIDAYDEMANRFYGQIKDLPAQAQPVFDKIKTRAAENETLEAALKTKPVLKSILDADNSAQIIKVEDLRQANSDLSALINNAERSNDYTLFNDLVDTKSELKNFLRNHPNQRIADAATKADSFYVEYRDALRRGDGSASAIMRVEDKLRQADYKTVNDSELGRIAGVKKGKEVAPENIQDYKKLGREAQRILGVPDATEDLTRQRMLSSFKQTMRNAPTPSKVSNFMEDWKAVMDEFPNVKRDFESLQKELLNHPDIALANKVVNPEGAFSERSTFESWMNNPESMDTAIAIANGDKTGAAARDLRDQFAQWTKDTITKNDTPENMAAFREVMNPATTKGKAVKALFEHSKGTYENYQNVAKIMKELEQDMTMNPGARAGKPDPKTALGEVVEAAVPLKLSLATRIKDWLRDSISKYPEVADEFTKDPKFAEDMLKYIQSGGHKNFENAVKRVQKITGTTIPVAVGSATAPRANEGEKNEIPKYVPDGAPKPSRDGATTPKALSPQSYKLPDKYKDNPMAAEVAKDVEVYANKHNVPVDVALMVFDSESDLGTNPRTNKGNDKSSAIGVSQMTDAALKDAEKILGRKLNRKDKTDSVEGGVVYARHVMDQYKESYGKDPKAWEVKALYQLGAGGFKALKDHGAQRIPAWQIMKDAAKNHRELFFAGNKALTPRQVLLKLEKKYGNASKEFQIASNEV